MKVLTFTKEKQFIRLLLWSLVCMVCQLPLAHASLAEPVDRIELEEALHEIGQKYQVYFNYDRSIATNITVDYEAGKHTSLEEALEYVLENTNLGYRIFDERFVVVFENNDQGIESLKEMIGLVQGFVDERETAQNREVRPVARLSTLSASETYKNRIVFGISGTVVDDSGEPLIGVNIQVKGTNKGTSTDFDGNFTFDDIDENAVLVVSYVGYQTQEIPVAGKSTVMITLRSDSQLLDEVVVVGYGTQKRKNLVGSVSEVRVEDISTRPAANIAQSLQGAVPGLNIKSSAGGDPSKTPSINIRGFNSINGGSPLILVDGIEEDISHVNPNDIETVTVLKDAEAAAIYGARGSFGVVLITTKSGREGEFKVDYSNNFSYTTQTTRTDFVTDPYVYAQAIDAAIGAYNGASYTGYNDEDWEIIKKVAAGEIEPYHEKQPNGKHKFYYKTDFYDYMFKKWQPANMHNIAISGGSNKMNGYFSGRIYKREKIQNIQDAQMNRYNLNFALNFKPYEWLELSGKSKFSNKFDEEYGGTKNGWGDVYGVSRWRDQFPIFPPTIDGIGVSVGRTGSGYVGRIGSLLAGNTWRRWNYENLTNTLRAKLTPIDRLELNFDYSNNISRTDRSFRYAPFEFLSGNRLKLQTGGLNRLGEWRWKDQYSALNLFGSYSYDVAQDHHFKLMMGYNQEQFTRDRTTTQSEGLLVREKANLALGTELYNIDGSSLDWAIQGYFGRFNYDFADKYLLEINARYDGSSRFPDGSRWGIFPSVGVAWKMDEENFWSGLSDIIPLFKLRGSYGRLGNQNVGVNTFRQLIGLGRTTWLENGQKLNYARVPSPLPQNIGWEKVTSSNVGVDFGFFDYKLTASIDLYERNTTDMYLPGEPLPAVFGASEPKKNYAALRNRGFEFSLGYNGSFDVMGSKLTFNVSGNVSNFKGVITKFDNPNGLLSSFREGQVLGEMWGYRIDGQFQSDEEAAQYQAQFDKVSTDLAKVYSSIFNKTSNSDWDHLKAGDVKYVDVNGDGRLDNGKNTIDDPGDLVVIGNAMPKFPFGFNISSKWKQFSISIMGQGVAKQDWYPSGPMYWATFHRPYVSFIRKDFLDNTWTPENPGNTYPQKERAYIALNSGRSLYNQNDYYLTNIGYLRVKNLTVGYTLPQEFTQLAKINKLRIFFSGENIMTWRFGGLTKYMDPEVVGSSISYSNPNSANSRYNSNTEEYPMGKTFSMGIQVSL
ncbi:TonB-dependent receptor [Membranicola marinus]|uniref:TonB-dependent receptor n=1 Tax=Membranihabitans marinus TaxID=1227546 RepID=A0A953HVW2_9BACT|nr:TonB-dependent receptor [Membranihabitans marinus]MBY5959121.1 TonB-dependent receptor [Membranihabitans marinus]